MLNESCLKKYILKPNHNIGIIVNEWYLIQNLFANLIFVVFFNKPNQYYCCNLHIVFRL